MSAAGSNPAPSAEPADSPPARIDFHLAPVHAVTALGRAATLAGVGVLAVLGVSASTGSPTGAVGSTALVLAWLLTAAGCLLSLLAAVRVLRPPVLVRVDGVGLRIRVLRGGGPRAVRWADVRTVRRERLAPGPSVVVELVDGRRSVVPEWFVAEGGQALSVALRGRLDAAHGQRRLRPAAGGGGGGI